VNALDRPMFDRNPRSGFRQFLWYWLPVLLYISLIFTMSSLTHPPDPLKFQNSDKLYHLGEYGLFSLLVGRAMRFSLSPYSMLGAAVMTVALVMMIAAADENYQRFVPGRDCDVFDWMTDSTAAVLATAALWQLWSRGLKRKLQKAS